jgi:hypothetical protein
MSSEAIAILANIALTLSLIVAIIFGLNEVKTAKRERRERLTIDTLHAFHSREFAELIYFTINDEYPKNYKEWLSWPMEDRVKFIQLTQQMESLGITLSEGMIDIDLVDKTLGSFVSTVWKKFQPLIESMRIELGDPYLSEYFQWIAGLIDKRLKEKPRKPFFNNK